MLSPEEEARIAQIEKRYKQPWAIVSNGCSEVTFLIGVNQAADEKSKMNLVDPKEIANALRPILDDAEKNISETVTRAMNNGVAQVNEAIQAGLDRLHGITITMEINVPPRAKPSK